eukprot:2989186-Rhodomonas_salina.1
MSVVVVIIVVAKEGGEGLDLRLREHMERDLADEHAGGESLAVRVGGGLAEEKRPEAQQRDDQ